MIEDARVARVILWFSLGGIALVCLAPLLFWIADRAADRMARRRARAWAEDERRQRERDFGKFGRR